MNKKILLIGIISLLLISGVIGADLVSNYKEKKIEAEKKTAIERYLIDKYDEKQKDESLKYDSLKEEEQDNIKKIEVNISDCVQFDDNHCKFSAVLPNVINSYDNVLPLSYIGEKNETIYYTDIELQTMAEEWVDSRINNFADEQIAKKSYDTKKTGVKVKY